MRKTAWVIVLAGIVSLVGAARMVAQSARAHDFAADYTFTGSQLTGWQPLGDADWRAANGVITGTAKPGAAGGWLLFNRSYQDVGFFTRFRCQAACEAGMLVRAEKTGEGTKGVLVSLTAGDIGAYRVTLDGTGKVLTRESARGGRGGGGAGRGAPAGGRGAAGGRGGGPGEAAAPGRGVAPPDAQAGGRAGGRGAADPNAPVPPIIAAANTIMTAPITVRPGEWNSMEILLDGATIQNHLNNVRNAVGGGNTGETEESGYAYGPVGLYVASGTVEFGVVSVKDLNLKTEPAEQAGPRFRVQRLNDFYYAWGADVADINRDGVNDIISGGFYYLGPNYTDRREFYTTRTYSPGTEYVNDMMTFATDFTGDGWPDVLTTDRRPMSLYVNPKGANRRWQKFSALPDMCSENAIRANVDADPAMEIVYVGGDGRVAYGEPHPENPTGLWIVHKISEPAVAGCNTHGIGVGDLNGDGRNDILQARGWWEQPTTGQGDRQWTHHEAAFGKITRVPQHPGGGEISVYDFNGDKLPDVVTSLSGHGWGLAWYEQKRDAAGDISFVEHMIMDTYATENAGGVTFSEPHSGATLLDVDRDGIMDFVAGKRHWAHLDGLTDPDPDGPGVVDRDRTVRDPRAPGGARFVPELIHNRSGLGTEAKVFDINTDGAMDIVTSTTRGTFVFWGIPGRR